MKNINEREDLDLSLKFGFLGLGMGGCSIAYECANIKTKIVNNMHPYTALLINTNEVDLRKFQETTNVRKYQLKGYEKGAGRNIEIGEQAYVEHKEEISNLIRGYFADRDFVWIVCGLGGGTGTGSILQAVMTLYANGFKGRCGFILTMPRDNEGSTVLENAIDRLKRFAEAMKGLGSILLVDNQKLYNDFIQQEPGASISEYLDYSNKYIANTLHEFNAITASFDPIAGYHFDSSEFMNMLKTPGIISIGKLLVSNGSIDVENEGTFLPDFKNSIQRGILSDGYQFKHANRIAVSLVANSSTAKRVFTMSLINKIERTVDELAPLAGEKPVAAYGDPKGQSIAFYSIVAGLHLPIRVTQLVKKAEELQQFEEEEEDSTLALLSSFSRKSKQTEVDIDLGSIFTSNQSKDKSNQEKTQNLDDLDPFKLIKSNE
ncbi:plasmid replication protein [Paenibacillus sp. GD4]|uniref:plasmid replication protein n=1 Tax=Paenibacillus sp. GD4 TaxID=3068890 RepID=UPI002796C90C|nr:plasmid replication protein [Paenibacillus sp. GD4]MDQ1914420.1 plasmid replication protein [Paenibacillus sp. GD4]